MYGSSLRNGYMLTGRLARRGYDWWWHSLTGRHRETGEERAFFMEYFVINPELSPNAVSYGQLSDDAKPSYFMLKAGSWGAGDQKKQLHAFLPIEEVSIAREALEVSTRERALVLEEDRVERPELRGAALLHRFERSMATFDVAD